MRLRVLVTGAIAALLVTATLVQAQGSGLETLEMGTGPTVIMVPGLGGTRTDWLPTVKRLREHFRCVMVEIPGQGKSPLPDPFTIDAAANALDGLVTRYKADSTIIVGQGLGGLLTLLAAGTHPDHQRGVVLIDTQVKSPIPIADQDRRDFERFMDSNYDTFSKLVFSKMGRDSVESARLYAMLAAVPPATVKAYLRDLLVVDANKQVKTLGGGAAYVFSERVWKTGSTWGTVAKAAGYEDSTAFVPTRVANSGTMVMKDQPDTLATLISNFAAARFAAKK